MENSSSGSRSFSILPIIATATRQSQQNNDSSDTVTKILLNESHQWPKWKCLWPRWSNPELCSLPSSTTVFNRESYFQRETDEENTISGSSTAVNDDDDNELKKKSLIALCKALMLYGAPCHRIVRFVTDLA